MYFADAEYFACVWMQSNGFPDARLTGAGSDGGIDVSSGAALAQVKALGAPVGRPDVQRLIGVCAAARKTALFFSTSGYSPQATICANESGVALFFIDAGGVVAPLNALALTAPASAEPLPLDPKKASKELARREAVRRDAVVGAIERCFPTGERLSRPKEYIKYFAATNTSDEQIHAAAAVSVGFKQGLIVVTESRVVYIQPAKKTFYVHECYRREVQKTLVAGRQLSFVARGRKWELKCAATAVPPRLVRAINTGTGPVPAQVLSGAPLQSAPDRIVRCPNCKTRSRIGDGESRFRCAICKKELQLPSES